MELLARLDAVFSLDPSAPLVAPVNGRAYSFAEVEAFGEQLAAFLREAGLPGGTGIAILLRNRAAHFAAVLATIRAGHTIVTVNPLLPPEPLRKDIGALKAPVLVADETDWNSPCFAEPAKESGALGLAIGSNPTGLSIRRIRSLDRTGKFRPATPEIVVEMLSSGTTGDPKRIALSRDAFSRALWTGSKYEAGAEEALKLKASPAIQWMPLVHIAGLFSAVYSAYNARRFILMEKFDLDAWHDLIVEHRPRFANIPPSRLGALLERNWPKEHLSSLLALRTGAAPLDHDLAVRFEERYGIPVLEGYGATEFAGGVAGWTIRDHREFSKTKRQSVGRANPGVELRVIDADTQEPLRPGEQGILEVRTKQIGEGKDWVRTTDIAHIDEDGFLYIHGRADNAINRGGFKVHPASVEDALRKLHGVRDACVVGISDAELGQVPVAAIELHSGASAPDVDEVKASLRTQLKPYEIPARFLWLEELPRTPSMKASQARVRELFLEGAS